MRLIHDQSPSLSKKEEKHEEKQEDDHGYKAITPIDISKQFNISIRSSSALLVTLCCMKVIDVYIDDKYDIDNVQYHITDSGMKFFDNFNNNPAYISPFIDTFTRNFFTPDKLLDCAKPQHDELTTDLMTQHLNEASDDEINNARHFIKHMNSQPYSCAKQFGKVFNLLDHDDIDCNNDSDNDKLVMIDVGGGSGIYTIEAAKQNANLHGIVYELPYIKPITQEYIENEHLSHRIIVHGGNFLLDDESFLPPPPSNNNNNNHNDNKVDLILFANIFHDWPDSMNLKLMEKAYKSLKSGGKIVISELLLSNDIQSSTSSSTSMNIIMLPYTKGRQYRGNELHQRLINNGFINPITKYLIDDYSLVMATKP